MRKTLGLLGLAAFLAAGTATVSMAASEPSDSQSVTGTQLGSPQTGTPATGSATMPTARSAQTTGPAYPGVVGPTGSRQPDATNPSRPSPTGGGTESGSGSGGASSSR